MKKLFLFTLCCLFPFVAWATVDTLEGEELTTSANIEGVTTTDTVEGQEVTAGGGTDYTADANCQGAWLFGDDLTDESGEGNTLTISSAPSYETTYPSGYSTGKSMHFDGADDYLSRADGDLSADFPGKNGAGTTEDFTYCFWVKRDDDASANERVFDKGGHWETNIGYGASWNELVIVHSDGSTSSPVWATGHSFATDSDWTHVCFSFDGSIETGTLWVSKATHGDQTDAATNAFTGCSGIAANATNFFVAADGGAGAYLDGYLYQAIIFDRTISDAEAEGIFTNGITGAD